jgi:hypothetical protein
MAAPESGGGNVFRASPVTDENSHPERAKPRSEAMAGARAEISIPPTQAHAPAALRSVTLPTPSAGEVCNLLRDCLRLWNVTARVTPTVDAIAIQTSDGIFTLQSAPADARPVRWFLQSPARAAANRPPRALPSVVAALSALRNALGGGSGSTLRIGPGDTTA